MKKIGLAFATLVVGVTMAMPQAKAAASVNREQQPNRTHAEAGIGMVGRQQFHNDDGDREIGSRRGGHDRRGYSRENPVPVPEPASMMLLGTGLIAVLSVKRWLKN